MQTAILARQFMGQDNGAATGASPEENDAKMLQIAEVAKLAMAEIDSNTAIIERVDEFMAANRYGLIYNEEDAAASRYVNTPIIETNEDLQSAVDTIVDAIESDSGQEGLDRLGLGWWPIVLIVGKGIAKILMWAGVFVAADWTIGKLWDTFLKWWDGVPAEVMKAREVSKKRLTEYLSDGLADGTLSKDEHAQALADVELLFDPVTARPSAIEKATMPLLIGAAVFGVFMLWSGTRR